jgi:hypothetical protein
MTAAGPLGFVSAGSLLYLWKNARLSSDSEAA